MKLRFLVDECAGQAVADYLVDFGYDVLTVSSLMARAGDTQVLAYAFQERRILVTIDKGFSRRVFKNRESHSGVILLRPPVDTTPEKLRMLQKLIPPLEGDLVDNFVTVSENRIRFGTVESID